MKRWLKILIAIAGLWLCVRLVQAVGWEKIVTAFQQHGYWLIVLTTVYTSYHVLRTWTLQICTPYAARIRDLFGVRLAGEALAYIAIGSVVGDALKVVLARRKIPMVEGATGVFAEKLVYHISGFGFIATGFLIAILRIGSTPLFWACLIAALFLFFVSFFLLSSRLHPIARILKHVRVRRPKLREAVLRTEDSLFQFRARYPARFYAAVALDFASFFYATIELFFIFRILNVATSFWDLWYYQAVIRTMNSIAAFVPANIGVFEATNVYVAKQLEFGEGPGMVAALFVRIRATLWSLIGYLWFLVLIGRGDEKG